MYGHARPRTLPLCPAPGFLSCLAAVALAAGSARPASGDEPTTPAQARKISIALLDVKYVLDHDAEFAAIKSQIEDEVKISEVMMAMRKASLEKLTADRARQPRSSAAYRLLDQALMQETAEVLAQVQVLKNKYLAEEGALYRDAYQRVQRIVDAYLEEQGISVVLRFQRPAAEELTDAVDIAKMLNRPIVAYKDAVDITDEVLRRLAKSPPSLVRKPASPTANPQDKSRK